MFIAPARAAAIGRPLFIMRMIQVTMWIVLIAIRMLRIVIWMIIKNNKMTNDVLFNY